MLPYGSCYCIHRHANLCIIHVSVYFLPTIADCGPPTAPVNGSVDAPETKYQAHATYSCAPGFNLTGPHTVKCLEDATWEKRPTCEIKGRWAYFTALYATAHENFLVNIFFLIFA